MFEVPDRVLEEVILPRLPLAQLTALCQTHPRISQLCRGPVVWQERLFLEFPESGPVPTGISPQDFYFDTRQWFNYTTTKFPEAPPKPANLLWSQYHQHLLHETQLTKQLIFVDHSNQTVLHLDQLKIIPGVTTLRGVFREIYGLMQRVMPTKTIFAVIFSTVPPPITVGNQIQMAGAQVVGNQIQVIGPAQVFTNVSDTIYSFNPVGPVFSNRDWVQKDIVVITLERMTVAQTVPYMAFPFMTAPATPLLWSLYPWYKVATMYRNLNLSSMVSSMRDLYRVPRALAEQPLILF